ncbi:MAG: DNA integrity scanning protein DisA nucleotide-binding domain protein [Bacillota bacterium]
MELATYVLSWTSIIDIFSVVLLLGLMFLFFAHIKSFRLAVVYSLALIMYVVVLVIDVLYDVPIAKDIFTILAFFAIVALVVVYQSEFKAMFFLWTKPSEKSNNLESGLSDEELRTAINEIIKGCQSMSKARTGALIVIATNSIAPRITETGINMGAIVSAPLLESIFNTNAPIHDGAAIITGNKITAAGCFLPLSQSQSVSKNLGTRHRAGIGITEETDTLTIILSEETGIISVAQHGELRRFITPDRLRDILHEVYNLSEPTRTRTR